MKNIIILLSLLLLRTVIFANDEYESAIDSYKQKDFTVSYEKLSKLYLTNLSDANLNFYLGRSAYETGHYEMALAAFERVEMLDEGNLRNRLEMARTYFMLKMYEDSELAFEEVLVNPNMPQNLRRNIELYLAKVKGVQQKSFTYATVNIDWIYDSNVNYGQLHDDIGGGFHAKPEVSDSALQVYGDITNIYDIGEKNGFFIKNRFIGLIKDYRDEDTYDLGYIAYSPSLLYIYTKHTTELVFNIDGLSIGKKDYLRTYSVKPRYEYAHTSTLRSMVHFKFLEKDFQQTSEYNLDARHYELGYSLQKILSPRSYAQLGLIGLAERKEHGTRTDVDYDEYRLNINYANQFTSIVGLEAFGEYRRRNYKEYAQVVYNSKRINDGATAALNLNFKILQTLRFHLKGMYTIVESNQDQFSYHKHTITLGINKTF